jgi:hypothetical protein
MALAVYPKVNWFADLDPWIVEGEKLAKLHPDNSTPDLVARLASGMLMALPQRNPSHDDFENWQMRCEAQLDLCSDPQSVLFVSPLLTDGPCFLQQVCQLFVTLTDFRCRHHIHRVGKGQRMGIAFGSWVAAD